MALIGASSSMQPRLFTVERVKRELADTVTLVLRSPGTGDGGFAFAPGQFCMLYVFGIGEVPISMSGDPADTGRLVFTVRAVGRVTDAIARLRPGAALGVRGPFGSGWPLDAVDDRDVVIVAGGIGLAPLRPAVYAVLGKRRRRGRLVILYGARTPGDILFRRELIRWAGRPHTAVDITVDRAATGWHGSVGVVTRLIHHAAFDAENCVALICGPEIMMRYAVQALADRGMAAAGLFVSLERNMRCAVGFCGHCQLGGSFVCRDGPVFCFERIADRFAVREL